jgi:hypothetical protein
VKKNSFIKVSQVEDNEKVKFVYSINIRRLILKPSLPARYWGNGCVPMYVRSTKCQRFDRSTNLENSRANKKE